MGLVGFLSASLSLAQVLEGSKPEVRETRIAGNLYVFVVNPLYAPVTFRLEVQSSGLRLSREPEFTQMFPPRSLTLAFWAEPTGPDWSYHYRWRYVMGDIGAVPDDTPYELPFAPGQAFKINQGYDGRFSHTGAFEYSLDFDLPEGTPVYAAREGVVVVVQDSYQAGRPDRSLTDKANCITVLHPDGTFAQYAHLRYGGSLVGVGQHVERGQMIGYSGNTGFTSGPHLHFHVYRVLNVNGDWETLPTRFATAEGRVRLLEGQVYTRPQLPNAQR